MSVPYIPMVNLWTGRSNLVCAENLRLIIHVLILSVPLCKNFTIQLGKDSYVSKFINTDAFELNREGYWSFLKVHALVTEDGTGVQLTGSKYVYIDSSVMKISFENTDMSYKQGLPYFGQAAYKANESCQAHGWVLPQYPQPEYFAYRFYSKTNSFLKIVQEMEELRCNQQKRVLVHYILNMEDFEDKTYTADFSYLVISKGVIILHGQQKIEINENGRKGIFSISIDVNPESVPSVDMLVYSLHPGGEMVTDSTEFRIEKCFENQVDLNFSKEKSLPGSNIDLQVSAASNSLCALWAVDQRVLLLRKLRSAVSTNCV
nr:ovostatin homolog [Pan troglodytes]XP_054520366.1 ovostatin homolog [Pan troglodytes]